MNIHDTSQTPEFLRSLPFQIGALRVRAVFLAVFMLAGVAFLGFTILYFLSGPAGTPEAPEISGKISILAFVVGWNMLVVWMFRHNMRTLAQLKKDKIAEQNTGEISSESAPIAAPEEPST
jgi:hypothetical protein